jgi:1-acyl-sn-glycerol-3-phosphate acyltransferase
MISSQVAHGGGETVGQRRLGFWRRLSVMIVVGSMRFLTKPQWRGTENLPAEGGFILAPNHMSQFDPLLMAHYVYASGRWPRFLAKSGIWKVPVVGFLMTKTLQIPVERGSISAAKSIETLSEAIREGGTVVIYPEGTTTRDPDLWPMQGKTGAARVALATGAPVVPAATWGAQAIHDVRTKKVSLKPRNPVQVIVGKPVDLSRWMGEAPTREVLEEMTEAILLADRELLAELRGEPAPTGALYAAPARRNGGRTPEQRA